MLRCQYPVTKFENRMFERVLHKPTYLRIWFYEDVKTINSLLYY